MKNYFLIICSLCLFLLVSCEKEDSISSELIPEAIHKTTLERTCSHQELMEKLLSNPSYEKIHREKLASIRSSIQTREGACTDPIVIPVVIHYQNVSNPDRACLVTLAERQMTIINNDFRGQNADVNKWTDNAAQSFPGIMNGDACVTFCLANKNHPSNFDISDGDLAVTINKTNGDDVPAWKDYLNIVVRPDIGALGYSPLGGLGNGDGVVIDAQAFGSGSGCGNISPSSPFDLGRTLTHEIGHYLLLDHIWGGGCNSDDDVADTPNSSDSYGGCPTIGLSSCSSTDMHMNYMDYTDDECMYVFSAGQANRMNAYVKTNLENFIAKASLVCDDVVVSPPTCNDGIQNGSETGIDCGGSCNPCDSTPTCEDGVKNGDETGIDCGGSCIPCEVTPTCNDGVQNGDETGVDCGGSCATCEVEPTCNDGIHNGDEEGIDCGGSCAPCNTNETCEAPTNLFVDVLSPSDVSLYWDAVESARKYRVQYKIIGTGTWMKEVTSTNSLDLSSLQANETYVFRVKSLCKGERSPWSERFKFETIDSESDDCSETELNLHLVFDAFPEETSWVIYDEADNVIGEGSNYGQKNEGDEISKSFCLEDGCYYFEIRDAYGDGICCDYGQGTYYFTDGDGNVVFQSNGEFGRREGVEFCIFDEESRNYKKSTTPKEKNLARKAMRK